MTPAAAEPSARRAALALIRRALDRGEMLDEAALPADLPPPERARALALARAALRWAGPADALVAGFVSRAPAPAARDILRLAIAEMLALGHADYAVVDAAVGLARGRRDTARAAGMVNAVLRRAAGAEGRARWAALDHGRLASPPWLTRLLRRDWGRGVAAAIGAAHLAPPPLDLTLKAGDPAEWAARLSARVTPTGALRLEEPGRVSALPGYEDGAWWAQDAAAALPARLAGPGAGRRALDLCAAPGGKTLQLAAAGWRVTALDASAPRMRRLEENLARTGLAADTVVADAADWAGGVFDLVLLDAPCSATGTIRRHPELPHIRDGAALPQLAAAQARLLRAAWARVAPGGALIYCVCSLARDEGEAQAAAFLADHPGAHRDPIAAAELGDPALVDEAGDLRTRPDMWPDLGGLDGFFACRMRRAA